nr:MAG TPA: hypothetical protein [Caudoviricetes sp.]
MASLSVRQCKIKKGFKMTNFERCLSILYFIKKGVLRQ